MAALGATSLTLASARMGLGVGSRPDPQRGRYTPGKGEPGDPPNCRAGRGGRQDELQRPNQEVLQSSLSLPPARARVCARACRSSLKKEPTQATAQGWEESPWLNQNARHSSAPCTAPQLARVRHRGSYKKVWAEEGLGQSSGLCVHSRAEGQPSQPGMEWG